MKRILNLGMAIAIVAALGACASSSPDVIQRGDAQRMALQERGRSEAQAELLRNITASLREANLQPDHPENVRKILLVRTAQILEGMRDIKTWKRETK